MFGFFHDLNILMEAEETINSFIDSDITIYFTDEEGNCFIPNGKISINFYQLVVNKGEEK